MSESMYAPPEADISVAETGSDDFYVVAPRKFFLLMVLTLNLYLVYWSYKNWAIIKQRTGDSIWPPMRGIFLIFFTHSLFGNVDEKIKAAGKQFDWSPGSSATLAVVLIVISNVLDRLAGRDIGSPMTDLASVIMAIVVPAAMLKAQRAINFACDDATGSTNSNFTLANWIWMILGALLWVLVLFGLYVMFLAPELLLE